MSAFQVSQDMKLREIVKTYRRVNMLHPIASAVFASPEMKTMFWTSLNHDLHVIRQRSQNLADGEITPVQKAFKILMDEEADVNAAVEIYLDEIIGLKALPEPDRAHILAQAIQTRDYIVNQSQAGRNPSLNTAYEDQFGPPSFDTGYGRSFDDNHTFHSHGNTHEGLFGSDGSAAYTLPDASHETPGQSRKLSAEDKVRGSFSTAAVGSEQNEMLRRLFITYQKAKNEFYATPKKSFERTTSAKFLRDTTENCIAYIASRQKSTDGKGFINTNIQLAEGQATLDEMRSTLQEARTAAEQGSGGKKRSFDEDRADVAEGPAKMRITTVDTPLGNRNRVLSAHTSMRKLGSHSVRRRIEFQPTFKSASSTDRYHRRVIEPDRDLRRRLPASAGRGKRRFFPMPIIHNGKHSLNSPARSGKYNAQPPIGSGDCYRPSYR